VGGGKRENVRGKESDIQREGERKRLAARHSRGGAEATAVGAGRVGSAGCGARRRRGYMRKSARVARQWLCGEEEHGFVWDPVAMRHAEKDRW